VRIRPARLLGLLILVPLLASAFASCPEKAPPPPLELETHTGALAPLGHAVSYERDVKPVLENRCVVCHACYDAPCQLLLSSSEGIERGASQQPVYDSSRLETMAPTRLFIDAQSTHAWRERGFFPVFGTASDAKSGPNPLVLMMLALGRAHPFEADQRLPDTVALDIDRSLSCATSEQFDDYARKHPQGGMPYGMAPLPEGDLRVLASWIAQQPPFPPAPALSARAQADVARWETFLNGPSQKEQIAARYLYEHWFVAHLSFDDLPDGPFFEVVRSRTAPGEPIDLIATVRPYDDPGVARVWYRIRPIPSTIAHKSHIVYRLGDARLKRLRELFLDSDWQPTRMPGYSREEASNPFIAFEEIPARSRYRFLLDDAHYFVMTFIRGPVCRGQVAVDVIEDQFWVSFVDPDHDLSVTHPEFLSKAKDLLSLPAEHAGSHFVPGEMWVEYNVEQHKYLEMREDFYDALDPQLRGPALNWVWSGDGTNTNALLTVFRNFDNATVVRGFVGEIPKTAWIMDYPIFERIYYDLVAGFDIYGNVAHQIATRLYMDDLRMQSENLFLNLLPADRRQEIRASWYVGATRQLDYTVINRLRATDHGTQVHYTSKDVKAELLQKILAQAGAAAGPPDLLNRCAEPPCDRPGASAAERSVERELQKVAAQQGDYVRLLPEVSLLRVRVDASGTRDLVYALVHNDAHTNVAFMFGEGERRIPADDTLTVIRGHFGSYPNFFFDTDVAGIAGFVRDLRALRSDADLTRFVEQHGIRRTSPRFWQASDWLRADLLRRDPVEAGVYDLNRYKNL
jgi:hypothetical protein